MREKESLNRNSDAAFETILGISKWFQQAETLNFFPLTVYNYFRNCDAFWETQVTKYMEQNVFQIKCCFIYGGFHNHNFITDSSIQKKTFPSRNEMLVN